MMNKIMGWVKLEERRLPPTSWSARPCRTLTLGYLLTALLLKDCTGNLKGAESTEKQLPNPHIPCSQPHWPRLFISLQNRQDCSKRHCALISNAFLSHLHAILWGCVFHSVANNLGCTCGNNPGCHVHVYCIISHSSLSI